MSRSRVAADQVDVVLASYLSHLIRVHREDIIHWIAYEIVLHDDQTSLLPISR